MKTSFKRSLLLPLLLLPLASHASIPRGPQFSNADIFLFLGCVLLLMANGILALINVMWKKSGVRAFNLVATGLMGACAIGLCFIDLKAGAIAFFIVLLLGFLIYLSRKSRTNGPQ
jgi:hypothetical protein